MIDRSSARNGSTDPLLPIKEAHLLLPHLSIDTLRRKIRNGELAAVKIGSGRGRIYIPQLEVARLRREHAGQLRDVGAHQLAPTFRAPNGRGRAASTATRPQGGTGGVRRLPPPAQWTG